MYTRRTPSYLSELDLQSQINAITHISGKEITFVYRRIERFEVARGM